MQIPLEIAYAEACQALGEAIVRERILSNALRENEQKQVVEEAEKAVSEQGKAIAPNGVKNNGAKEGLIDQNHDQG